MRSFTTTPPTTTVDRVSSGDGTRLSELNAFLLDAGCTIRVDSVKADFELDVAAGASDGITKVDALGKPGYQWCRLQRQTLFWQAKSSWFVDPSNGSDEADGTTSTTACKTLVEVTRRMSGCTLSQATTITLLGDAPDGDLPIFDPTITIGGSLTLKGVQSILATQTISLGTLWDPDNNKANEVTVTGFDWTPYIGRFVQNAALPTTVATIAKDLTGGKARLGSQYVSSANTGAGFQTGQVLNIFKCPKISGFAYRGQNYSGNVVQLTDLIFTTDALTNINIEANFCLLGFLRVECRAQNGRAVFVRARGMLWNASSATGAAMQWFDMIEGMGGRCGAFINMTGGGFTIASGCNVVSPRDFLCQNSSIIASFATPLLFVKGVLGMFDLAAGAIGINLLHYSRLIVEAPYFGTGNNATAIGIAMGWGCQATCLFTRPNMDAGINYNHPDGTNHAWSELPQAFDVNTGTSFWNI